MKESTINSAKVLEKIVLLRTALGISQYDMAVQLNLSDNGYFKVEKGKTKLDLKRFFLILEILETSPKDFFADF